MKISALKPSFRMPVLFLGHGSPMNAVTDNSYRRSWQTLGTQFGASYPRPQLIVCVSAHWLTRGWAITGMEKPRTIHDFGGFPQTLFDQQYPAPGHPAAAKELATQLDLTVDGDEWGLDHGTWAVLKPMFPAADIPVLQLSINWDAPPMDHFKMGQKLRSLRDQGVLIVASGNTVHNLGKLSRGDGDAKQPSSSAAFDWAKTFDAYVEKHIRERHLSELANFQNLGSVAKLAHPSYDHYLPLLYAAGASDEHDQHAFFNDNFDMGSLAMRSVIWGS